MSNTHSLDDQYKNEAELYCTLWKKETERAHRAEQELLQKNIRLALLNTKIKQLEASISIAKYNPPQGVIGYARKEDIDAFIESESQHSHIGLDSPVCWRDEPPYPWLVALCVVNPHTHIVPNVTQE